MDLLQRRGGSHEEQAGRTVEVLLEIESRRHGRLDALASAEAYEADQERLALEVGKTPDPVA
ncbi:MAG: hypothetical protein ACYSWX_09705, partial [Planctomycetota bacterium]